LFTTVSGLLLYIYIILFPQPKVSVSLWAGLHLSHGPGEQQRASQSANQGLESGEQVPRVAIA